MPGVVGVISKIHARECESLVHSMISCMKHESFYVSGTHFVPEMGIYAGWVALDGSFAAQQVFMNDRNDIILVFAGECLPGSESQAVHDRNGNLPDDKSWLIRLYEEQGDNFFEKLNGLFSGLLIDKRQKRAFLFNDRYGLERLYVCDTKKGFYFASEAKALLQILPELRRFDEVGVTQFLTFGCTLEWQTLFRGLELLPGGSLCVFEAGSFRRGRYFSSASWESFSPATEEAFESKFEKRFKRILPYYCEAEPRVGIALTGGLDTRMIMACLPETEEIPVSYTFTGERPTILDSKLASRVAEACGLDHRNLQIGSDFFVDFPAIADQTVYVTDGCLGITGAHEIYFNRKARQLAPTRLTGNFGSEILRGMSTFKPLGLSRELFHKDINHAVDSCAAGWGRQVCHPVSFAAFREIPWNLFGSLAAGRSQVTFRTPYLDNELVALAFRAPKHLRRSSVAALNLVKSNNAVLGAIATDRGRGGSLTGPAYLLRRFFCYVTFKLDYICSESLPGVLTPFDALIQYGDAIGITGLHKFLRYRRWFRTKLRAYLEQALADARAGQLPFWNVNFLERMAAEHVSGRKNYLREINAVLTLAAIDRLILHKRF
jgi:asparagine synthase (glutamine-hydrolysing)